MTGNRVLLATLSVRTSAKGNAYLSGWLGKASVVGFRGDPDRFGNATWNVYVAQPEPRPGPPLASPRPVPPASGSSPSRHRNRESAAARQERLAGEVAAAYGVSADEDLNDDLPF